MNCFSVTFAVYKLKLFVASRKKLYSLVHQLKTKVAMREVSMFDKIVKNGYIVDGTGSPRFRADVGIKNGKIAKIGSLGSEESQGDLDVEGLVVSPGFIDMHSHSDFSLLINPQAESKIRQGNLFRATSISRRNRICVG